MATSTSLIDAINRDFTAFVQQHKTYPDCIFISTNAYDRLVAENRSVVYMTDNGKYEQSLLHYRTILEGDDGMFMFGLCVHRFVSHEPKWFFGVYGGMAE